MSSMHAMHYKRLDLNLLVAFCALMSHRNVTRAAREINITQPALSHALARLRAHYRDPLFHRVKGSMQPTARAQQIFEPISRSLEQIATTFQPGFEPRTLNRAFRIGLVDYPAAFLLPALTLKLGEEAPDAQLIADHMSADSAERMLAAQELDFAIGVLPRLKPAFAREPNTVDRFVVIARQHHPQIGRRLTLARYANLQHVRIRLYGAIDSTLRERGVQRKFSVEAQSVWNVPFLVARSDLLATVPEIFAAMFGQMCRLEVYRPPFRIDLYRIDLVWHKQAQSDPAHVWLREIIQATAADIRRDLRPAVATP